MIGPDQKKICFRSSGRVTKKGPTGDLFFSFWQTDFFFQKWAIFPYQTKTEVKKKKKLRPPKFFYGGLVEDG